MKRTTRNEACFSDVFRFAETEFGHTWNQCCDVFHSSEFFTYKSHDDFELEELEADEEDFIAELKSRGEARSNFDVARQIMIAYMKHHKVKRGRIYND